MLNKWKKFNNGNINGANYTMFVQVNGEYHWLPVTNFIREDIVKWMELMRTQDDDGSALRFRKMWHTDFPSIQGPWTPFTFKDPSLNLAEFPDVSNSLLFCCEENFCVYVCLIIPVHRTSWVLHSNWGRQRQKFCSICTDSKRRRKRPSWRKPMKYQLEYICKLLQHCRVS